MPTSPQLQELNSQRSRRSLIFNLLYSAEACDYQLPLLKILQGYQEEFDYSYTEEPDILATANSIIQEQKNLDELYQPLLSNWRFERLGIPTRLILRFAVWELVHSQTEPIIIINEAIELAKSFAEKDAYKFVNGILDEVTKRLGKVIRRTI